jgi:hypothetical protein
MGLRETIGEGPLLLAHRAGRRLYCDAAGRTGDAREWVGHCRGKATQELDARAGSIKHFFAFVCEKVSQSFAV